MSTRVSGSWTFRSEFRQGPQCTPLPLLAVRFASAVDLHKVAPAGEFAIPVTVARHDGPARITSLEVDVSYDDGRSWQPAAITPDGDAWRPPSPTRTAASPPCELAPPTSRATLSSKRSSAPTPIGC